MTISPFLVWTLVALYHDSSRKQSNDSVAVSRVRRYLSTRPLSVMSPKGSETDSDVATSIQMHEPREQDWLIGIGGALRMLQNTELRHKCSHMVARIAILVLIIQTFIWFLVSSNPSVKSCEDMNETLCVLLPAGGSCDPVYVRVCRR